MKLLVTGGMGFIGSAVVRRAISEAVSIVNVDALTYAACPDNVASVSGHRDYAFEHVDIRDATALRRVFDTHRPDAVMHLAAESHVDRSIDAPETFIGTNIDGTYLLLEAARRYWTGAGCPEGFRFLHVSTDEVFGALGDSGQVAEDAPYAPSSPYAASKAASDHLVRAWHRTYGLPTLVTHGTNTFGPYQFPEKLIPVVVRTALAGAPIPIYGSGRNVRDWIHVDDHVDALFSVLRNAAAGNSYNVGGGAEIRNRDLVALICGMLDRLRPKAESYAQQITFVADRPGHDHRYALDATRIHDELGWQPSRPFEAALEQTICWYLKNEAWWGKLLQRPGAGWEPDWSEAADL